MKRTISILSAIFTLSIFTSCASVKDISPDLSAAQLIQFGQSAFDYAQYKNAEQYFLTAIERYGDNTYTYIEAKYELGHLYLKQKNYKKAYHAFKDILIIYDNSTGIPGSYKKLCLIGMNEIPESKLKEFEKSEN